MRLIRRIFERKRQFIDKVQDKHVIYFLNSITNALVNSFSSFNDTVHYINSSLISLLHVERSFVFLFNEPKTKLRLFSCAGMLGMDVKNGTELSVANFFVKDLLENGDYIITDVSGDSRIPDLFRKVGSTYLLFAPLMFRKDSLGILVLDTKRDKTPFGEGDITYLEQFVGTLSIVIQNARIMERMRHKEAKLETVYKIANEMNSMNDLDALLNMILEEGLSLVDGRTGALMLLNEETQTLDIRCARGIGEDFIRSIHLHMGEGITGWAAKTGKVQRVDDVRNDPRYVKTNEEVRSELAAPLLVDRKVIGVIAVDSDEIHQFNDKDEELLAILASQAAIAINHQSMKKEIDELKRR